MRNMTALHARFKRMNCPIKTVIAVALQ